MARTKQEELSKREKKNVTDKKPCKTARKAPRESKAKIKDVMAKKTKIRKPHKMKRGYRAARAMDRAQRATGLMMRKAPIQALITEVLNEIDPTKRITYATRHIMQQGLEHLSTERMRRGVYLLSHSRIKTLSPKQLAAVKQITTHDIV